MNPILLLKPMCAIQKFFMVVSYLAKSFQQPRYVSKEATVYYLGIKIMSKCSWNLVLSYIHWGFEHEQMSIEIIHFAH